MKSKDNGTKGDGAGKLGKTSTKEGKDRKKHASNSVGAGPAIAYERFGTLENGGDDGLVETGIRDEMAVLDFLPRFILDSSGAGGSGDFIDIPANDDTKANNALQPNPEADFIPVLTLDKAAAAPRTGAEPLVAEAAAPSARPPAPTPGRSEASDLPWMPPPDHLLPTPQGHLAALHNEIVRFTNFLQPTEEELQSRTAAVDRIRSVVLSIWPRASVEVFGSFATGLYLPTSDVDLVVLSSGAEDIPNALRALASKLSKKNLATEVQVIAKARVPIIKFVDRESKFNFDISFDMPTGPKVARYVGDLVESLPQLRHLMLVIKVFLQQRELNEVYSGGIGSYCLLAMIASFLITHPSREGGGALEACLGTLLLDFFLLYGRLLRNEEVGASCRAGALYFAKRSKGWWQPERPFMLAVEDPQDTENDLGRNSFNFPRIRAAFEHAYQLLARPSAADSVLMRVLRWDDALIVRPGVEGRMARLMASEGAVARELGLAPQRREKSRGRDRDRERERERVSDKGRKRDREEEEDEEAAREKKKRRGKRERNREREREDSARASLNPEAPPFFPGAGLLGPGAAPSLPLRPKAPSAPPPRPPAAEPFHSRYRPAPPPYPRHPPIQQYSAAPAAPQISHVGPPPPQQQPQQGSGFTAGNPYVQQQQYPYHQQTAGGYYPPQYPPPRT